MTSSFLGSLAERTEALKSDGLYKTERLIAGPQQAAIDVRNNGTTAHVLNLCANNYLGLANHPSVIAAAHKALDEFGYGMASVRFICGTQTLHKELEQRISEFLGTEDTILYPSCFDANGGLFETILDGDDACPLEGPADPALGEILEADGCIRQSECSDGIDNDDDGDIDYPADAHCDDILDDMEAGAASCEAFACGDGPCDTETGPDACFCFATDPALTEGICVDNFFCSGGEDCSADASICAPLGKVCFYATCCGAPLCGPAQCTGVIQISEDMSLDPGPTAAGL